METGKIALGGVAGLAIAVLILNFVFGRDLLGLFGGQRQKPEQVARQDQSPPASRAAAPHNNAARSSSTPTGDSVKPPATSPAAPESAVAPSPHPAGASPSSSAPASARPDDFDEEAEDFATKPGQPESFRPPSARRPAPSRDALQKQRQIVEQAYPVQEVDSDAARVQLANRLLAESTAEGRADAERFVMLRVAAELASQAGDSALMALVVDLIADRFEIDALNVKAAMLVPTAEQIRSPQAMEQLVGIAKTLIDQAVEAERIDLAMSLAETTHQACAKNELGAKYRDYVAQGRRFLQQMQADWSEYQNSQAALGRNPEDAEANLVVGRWLCLRRGAWPAGLPHLSKGADPVLKRLAQRDLAASADPVELLETADGWRQVALATEPNAGCLARAYHLYEQALPFVQGKEKAQVEARLLEIREFYTEPKADSKP